MASLEQNIKEENLWKTPAQILIESIPKEDRGHFVVYHLSKALNIYNRHGRAMRIRTKIPAEKYESFEKMPTYPQLPSDMLKWTKKTFNATDLDIQNLVTTYSAICPNFGCFDPNDVGQMCCPF